MNLNWKTFIVGNKICIFAWNEAPERKEMLYTSNTYNSFVCKIINYIFVYFPVRREVAVSRIMLWIKRKSVQHQMSNLHPKPFSVFKIFNLKIKLLGGGNGGGWIVGPNLSVIILSFPSQNTAPPHTLNNPFLTKSF